MIFGKRIRLRGVERSDLPKFQEWLNDPEVTDGLSMYLPLSLTDEEKWFDRPSQVDQAEKPLSIELKQGRIWRLIGNSGFFNLEWTNRCAEFGIFIGDKSLWNKGYGTEAVELILRHGFETLNLNRIYLRVYSTNPRARAFVRKGGLRSGGDDASGSLPARQVCRHPYHEHVAFGVGRRPGGQMSHIIHIQHEMKVYGEIKLFAGSGSPELAAKISTYLGSPLCDHGNWSSSPMRTFSLSSSIACADRMSTSSSRRLRPCIAT